MTEPRIIRREDHSISRKDIDPDTVRVLYKLKDAGYEAYLVGGAVRDLLMGRKPKDFDVATDARPRDLRRIFRNSREVGRRFRIVHVYFGPKNIEVATLRSAVEPPDGDGDRYIEDDNQWGDLESDSFRRDFTCNALFYDIRDFAVVDYTGGVADLDAKLVRCIGDPQVRFREDPVRMLRAIKFAARFGWHIELATDQAIRDNAHEIEKASRFRVTEELFRILGQANRRTGMSQLLDYGFLDELWGDWLDAIGEEGFNQVLDVLDAIDRQAVEREVFYPIEILAAGMFLPLLDTCDPSKDRFNDVAARVTREARELLTAMDLPKKLGNQVVDLLRGQLYILFFAHLTKRVRRFVDSDLFDPAWQLWRLAYGDQPELAEITAAWQEARSQVRRPMGGTVGAPDRRDIFSFRGKTGGGRNPPPPGARFGGKRFGADQDEDDADWAQPALADVADEDG